MANTKISQLPTWSGTAADLRWFVMNNSGNTETFKFSGYTSQLIPGPGITAYRTLNSGTPNVTGDNDIVMGSNARTTNIGGIAIGKNAIAGGVVRHAVAIGQDTSATGTGIIVGFNGNANGDAACAFGINNTATAETSIAIGYGNNATATNAVCIGRDSRAGGTNSISIGTNIPSRTGTSNVVIGNAADTNSTNPSDCVVIGSNSSASAVSGITIGKGSVVSGSKGIALGNGLTNSGAGSVNIGYENSVVSADSVVIGRGSNINTGNYNQVAIGTLASSSQESAIAIGVFANANQINGVAIGNGATGYCSIGVNANSSNAGIAIGAFNTASATASISIGYAAGSVSSSAYGSKFGGEGNTLSSTGSYNHMNNGKNNTISGTTSYSNIFNGSGNTVGSAFSGVTMLSCFGRTANANNTTYTENHSSFGQSYQGYYDNGSGSTFTIDWNNGNTQKMSFTGAGGITCNNTQTGAHYRMVINNPNGYTPTSFTAAGRTIKFNGGSFVVYSGESICELFITNDSVFVNQLGLFS